MISKLKIIKTYMILLKINKNKLFLDVLLVFK